MSARVVALCLMVASLAVLTSILIPKSLTPLTFDGRVPRALRNGGKTRVARVPAGFRKGSRRRDVFIGISMAVTTIAALTPPDSRHFERRGGEGGGNTYS
eukprot:1347160-Amorphochlora_amoeboformis.AAC.1